MMELTQVKTWVDAQEWVIARDTNPEGALKAFAEQMFTWSKGRGRDAARSDRSCGEYSRDVPGLATAFARSHGHESNMPYYLDDLSKHAFMQGYWEYERENPLTCKCCGQTLPVED